MKYLYVILLAILISGCSKAPQIEFSGSTPGINDGLFSVKNINDSVLFKADIQSGKFYVKQKLNVPPGYYIMTISKNGLGTVGSFDFYVEGGTYNITTNSRTPFKYPDIHSTSKKANDLAAYYHVSDSVSDQIIKKTMQLTTQVNSPQFKLLAPAAQDTLSNQLKNAKANESTVVLAGIAAFVAKYPDNEIASHIMINANYQADPVSYYRVYQKFSTADKNSATGTELKHWLQYYINKPIKQIPK